MQGSELYIGNLDYSVTKKQIEDLFSNYGQVIQAYVIEGKGFGFIELSNSSEAEKAKDALNGYKLKGHILKVAKLTHLEEHNEKGYRKKFQSN